MKGKKKGRKREKAEEAERERSPPDDPIDRDDQMRGRRPGAPLAGAGGRRALVLARGGDREAPRPREARSPQPPSAPPPPPLPPLPLLVPAARHFSLPLARPWALGGSDPFFIGARLDSGSRPE